MLHGIPLQGHNVAGVKKGSVVAADAPTILEPTLISAVYYTALLA